MKRIRVLMLGWEFPPIINGGLGVACLGISKALSRHVHQQIILPKSDPSIMLSNAQVIGLNEKTNIRVRETFHTDYYQGFEEVYTIESSIDAYGTVGTLETPIKKPKTIKSEKSGKVKETYHPFVLDHLYGHDTAQKVIEYAYQTADLVQDWNFDIIHAHDWMTMLAGVEIKRRTGKPLVVHVHSLEYDRTGATGDNWVFSIEKLGMEEANVVIPVSAYTASVAQEVYHIPSTKIQPVHNGIDFKIPYKEKKAFPEKLVLFIGRLTHQKGPEYFLEVADRVLKTNPNTRFVIAGTGDKFQPLIETGAYKHIGTKVHFTGFLTRDKIQELLSMADVYVMPSVSEPFGLSALEAAQFGIPCIVSKQSGVAEVLTGAITVDYWDVTSMVKYINLVLQDQALANTMSKNAETDAALCTWDRTAEEIKNIYRSILNS